MKFSKLNALLLAGIIVIAIIIFLLISQRSKSSGANGVVQISKTGENIADSPVNFGYKCVWFAVKTENKNRLAELLKLNEISSSNWKSGIEKAYNNQVFITPPIDGWTLACGLSLPHSASKEAIDKVKEILTLLSSEFGEAQYFCTEHITEYHCWMKAKEGEITRVYSYLGETGENIVVEGKPTKYEKKLNLGNTLIEGEKDEDASEKEDQAFPNEATVMKIAEHWSIDPSKLAKRTDIPPSLGLTGKYK